MKNLSQKTKRRQHGFTLIEATFAMLIFGFMVLVFGAVFPTALRSSKANNTMSQAAALALHKVEQIRGAGYTALQSPANLVNLGIADSGSASASSLPYSATFTGVDHLTSGGSAVAWLPAGSTGTISVQDYHSVNASVPAGVCASVTVVIQWQSGGMPAGQYTLSALVVQTPHS